MSNPVFDFGKLSQDHLRMILDNSLEVWGLSAQIFSPIVYDNGYEGVLNEYTESAAATGVCKVLLSQPITGFMDSDYISLSDKPETQYVVTTNIALIIENELLILFPDSKTLRLRITENITFHTLTTVAYKYNAIVV